MFGIDFDGCGTGFDRTSRSGNLSGCALDGSGFGHEGSRAVFDGSDVVADRADIAQDRAEIISARFGAMKAVPVAARRMGPMRADALER